MNPTIFMTASMIILAPGMIAMFRLLGNNPHRKLSYKNEEPTAPAIDRSQVITLKINRTAEARSTQSATWQFAH